MVCLGFVPGAAGWKAQTNPLSYGGTPVYCLFFKSFYVTSFKKSNYKIQSNKRLTIETFDHRVVMTRNLQSVQLFEQF